MRRSLALLAAALVPCGALIPAAGCSSAGNGADASADGTVVFPGGDAGSDDAATDGGTTIATSMRLANMSPDLGPVDFCWRVTGMGSFTGPVLGGSLDGGSAGSGPDVLSDAIDESVAPDSDATSMDDAGGTVEAAADAIGDEALPQEAGDTGPNDAGDSTFGDGGGGVADASAQLQVAFGSISAFERLPVAGTLDIALVAPNQLSCGQPRFVGQITLDPDKVMTVVVMGLLEADAGTGSALAIKAFTDEPGAAQGARLRFIHAALGWNGPPGSEAPAPALTVQVAGAVVVPELSPTDVAMPSTSPAIDALGYTGAPTIASSAPVELLTQGDAQSHTWATPFFGLGLLPGTSHTAFIVSLGGGALGVAWCGVAQFGEVPPSCVLQTAR